jgi:acyl-CoA thioester hydrolase
MAFRDGFQPPSSAYAHRFRVAEADIDEQGHANNVVWVRWLNEAAIAHSEAIGCGRERMRELGAVWLVRRHDIEYLEPALLGEELVSWTWPATMRGATSLRRTVIVRGEQLLARAETTWVLIDALRKRPRRVTPELLAAYGFTPA